MSIISNHGQQVHHRNSWPDLAGGVDKQALGTFLERALQVLRPVVYAAVGSLTPGCALQVVQHILPTLCKLAEQLGPSCRKEFACTLWASCR